MPEKLVLQESSGNLILKHTYTSIASSSFPLSFSHALLSIWPLGEILGDAVTENTGMKSLSLAWNCIRGKGAIALAKGLGVNMIMLLSCSTGTYWDVYQPNNHDEPLNTLILKCSSYSTKSGVWKKSKQSYYSGVIMFTVTTTKHVSKCFILFLSYYSNSPKITISNVYVYMYTTWLKVCGHLIIA